LEYLELERSEQSTGGVLLAAIQRIENTINRGSIGISLQMGTRQRQGRQEASGTPEDIPPHCQNRE
jgi:hypothetical protein